MNRTKSVAVYPNTSAYGVGFHLSKKEFHAPKEQCEFIVKDTLSFVTFNRSGAFQTDRHARYPTTDLDVIKILDNARGLALTTLVYPVLDAMRRYYDIPSTFDLVLADFFFAKYEPSAQNSLERHTDGSLLSFVVNLSDPETFTGGTLFIGEDQTGAKKHEVRLFQGDAVIFPGGVLAHRVTPVLSGQRFVLTGFVEIRHQQLVPSIVVKEWCNRFQAECQKCHDQRRSPAHLIRDIPNELETISKRLPPRLFTSASRAGAGESHDGGRDGEARPMAAPGVVECAVRSPPESCSLDLPDLLPKN